MHAKTTRARIFKLLRFEERFFKSFVFMTISVDGRPKLANYEIQKNSQLIAQHCFIAGFWSILRAFHLA